MINKKSLQAVENAKFSKRFCRPLYESYCFSKIPATVEELFSAEQGEGLPIDARLEGEYDHVIFLFIDGFGWQFFEKYKNGLGALQKLERNGIVSKITSMFPSTTAAHVTCANTGLTPSQSGIYEWFLYEPKLNDIIAPLPFSYAGKGKPDSLPIDPQTLFPQKTLYQKLKNQGVRSVVFQPEGIANSIYSQSILAGAEVIGYDSPEKAFEELLASLNGKTYSYFYYGEIDAVGHRKGIYSKEFGEKIHEIFVKIERLLTQLPPKTALMLTADHGMVGVNPKQTYYLNQNLPNIEKYLVFGQRKKALAPAGSCRDFFLHVRPEKLMELKEILEHFLVDRAEIYLTKQLIEEGFFGEKSPSANFLNRVGNLVILPYKEEAVWWYEKGRFQQNFYAAHGGLTREEMEIPFLFYAS